jgi:hypothetical protein
MMEKLKKIIEDTDRNFAAYYDDLGKIVRDNDYKHGVEVGVFCGGQSLHLFKNTDIKTMILIDPYKMYEQAHYLNIDNQDEFDKLFEMVKHRFANVCSVLDPITPTNKVVLRFNTASNYRGVLFLRNESDKVEFDGTGLDFCFLDGNHTYDALKKDLEIYGSLIRKGGTIACHDYNHCAFPELTTCIDEYVAAHGAKLEIGNLHFVSFKKTW